MERTKYLLIILTVFLSFNALGQNNKAIYQAYISGDMGKWKHTMDSIAATRPNTNPGKLELVNYQYGYIGWCIENHKTSEAKSYMEKLEQLIGFLEQQKYELSKLYAYRAALIGYQIGIAPYKAPFIGSESLAYAKQSLHTDSLNSLGHNQLGNIAYHTPKLLGGSKQKALQHYLKALKIWESQKQDIKHNWNYLNLIATIIKTYFELGQYEQAKKYCTKALKIEPKFDWVKNKMCPEIQNKQTHEQNHIDSRNRSWRAFYRAKARLQGVQCHFC